MGRKQVSLEKRQEVLKLFKLGYGAKFTSKQVNISISTAERWLFQYRQGNMTWTTIESSNYSPIALEIKLAAVEDYIAGKGGYRVLASKYGIPKETYIARWVSNYKKYGVAERRKGRPKQFKEQAVKKKQKQVESKTDGEIIEEQKIRIEFLENLMEIREEDEKDPKKKAYLRQLREQYKKMYPSEES